ncbi:MULTISPECIES: hypothetical protein [Pseudomonas]|jgi:hypothetical protein|uniref:Uncharacterized protein n=1 Tax=Pseudomonas neustonica TaxID=2487346 RepID=A0ABX9XES7_9PSED|nr:MULTISPECIES: hypothetical protein [Pseudomonas]MBA6421813.1 hypothetical protein [Pseudomonas sp. 5Ae-yellow]ROZ80959.1 hypothetical protein EF099_16455 [Pseudomonas sp. SSM44]ROZ82157.1 hypothetical protein EF096_15990 [Pseudomonas neustonica]|tara:strand:+ start:35423 stop:36742 length:1320 start_codon:yes stop_codon:yes gene_type:complete
MAVRLEFLTQDPDEIELAKRYWAMDEAGTYLEKVTGLVPFRQLTQSSFISSHVRKYCRAYDENQQCSLCNGPVLVTKRHEPRKAFELSIRPCTPCAERIKQDELRIKQAEEAELQRVLQKRSHDMACRTISYDALPDDICVLLLAMDALIGPRLTKGTFRENECAALAPYDGGFFLRRLREVGIILDQPSAARPGTYFLENGQIVMRWAQAEFFLVADDKYGRGEDVIRRIAEREFNNPDALFDLWLDYATSDAARYLLDQCRIYNLAFGSEDVERIKGTIRQALRVYSTSQLWSVIWKVVKDASSLASHMYFNRIKASATIPNKIRKQLERAGQEDGISRYWSRPEHHLAGSLGTVFSRLFGLDENTNGQQAHERFAQLVHHSSTEADEALESLVRSFILQAQDNPGAVQMMCQFADLVRSGLQTKPALEEIIGVVGT